MIKWIKIKDKLPPKDKMVLCYLEFTDTFFTKEGLVKQGYLYKMSNCNVIRFNVENCYWKVTHWAELETPK